MEMIPPADYACDIARVIAQRTWFFKKPDTSHGVAFYTGSRPINLNYTACVEVVRDNKSSNRRRYIVVFSYGYWVEIELAQCGEVSADNPPQICDLIVYGCLRPSELSGYPRRPNRTLSNWYWMGDSVAEDLKVWTTNLGPFFPSFKPYYEREVGRWKILEMWGKLAP